MKQTTETILALIRKDIDYIKNDVEAIKRKLNNNYVTKGEFSPVKNIVYGMVGVILFAVLGAVVGLVIIK